MTYRNNVLIILTCLLIAVFSFLSTVTAQQCTDNDNDGYAVEGGLCGIPDCDDSNPLIYPGAVELCNGIDDDCSGLPDADEQDMDSEGYRLCDVIPDCNDFSVATDTSYKVNAEDIDGDLDIDIIVANNGQNRLYFNDGSGHFIDETIFTLPVDSDISFDPDFGDIDGDGDLDIFIANLFSQNRLYINDGTGSFTDVTYSRLPVDRDKSIASAFGDVDNDGDLDIMVANNGSQNVLLINNGTGLFSDETLSRLPLGIYADCVANFGDADGDGDLDIAVGNCPSSGGQNRLLINNGMGVFSDETAFRLPISGDITFDIEFGISDMNGDGAPDMLIANGAGAGPRQNRILINDGSGHFSDETSAMLPSFEDKTFDMDLGDVDGDLDLDIIVANTGEANVLLINDGFGFFTNESTRLPIETWSSREADFGDVDSDGDLDIIVANNGQNKILINDGTGYFSDAAFFLIPGNSDASVYPGADKICFDGKDNNCDSRIYSYDGACMKQCQDNDGDGFGSPGMITCYNGPMADCNDNDQSINPGIEDNTCNNIDENCDGFIDEGYVMTISNCGYSNCSSTGLLTCLDGVEMNTCIPGSALTEGPAGDPTCYDSIDNDCDGEIDSIDGNCIMPCLDNDGDGYGNPGNPECPNGPVIDCNDNNPDINPDQLVNCDDTINDCYSYAALTWEAPVTNIDGSDLHDLAGYRIYYGEASNPYTNLLNVGNNTCYVVGNLTSQEWCFAVTAYDILGNESNISNEVCKFIN